MKNQYDMYKAKLDEIQEEDKLEAIYRWTKGDWITVDTFRLLVAHVLYPKATIVSME